MKLYDRRLELILTKDKQTGKSFEGMHVSFDILQTESSETNTAEIDIYNLSDNSLAEFEKGELSIILKVGYSEQENLSSLFIGDIIKYIIERSGTDTILKVTCKDGFVSLTTTKLSLSFGENTTTQQILKKIISELNLVKQDYSGVKNLVYKNGFSFVGKPSKVLDTVLDRVGYEWNVLNNSLVITKKNEVNNTIPVQLLSKETGLLEEPMRLNEKKVSLTSGKSKTTQGWKIKSLLLPGLAPKSIIKIKSKFVNGLFKIKSVRFVGDNFGNDWFAEMEVEEL